MVKAVLLSLEKNILDCVEEIKERYRIHFICLKVIDNKEAENAMRDAENMGADIVFTYGLQPLVNGPVTKLPVINIMLSGQDIGILLKEAKALVNKQRPEIALLVYSCMFRRSSNLGEMFGVGLNIYMLDEYENHEVAVAKAVESGVHMIISVREVCALAEKQEIPTLNIFSGKEGVLQALRHAELLSHNIEKDKKSAAEKDAVMTSILHGIIEVNKNGEIIKLNDYAKNLLDCKNRNIVGQPLLSYFPRTMKDCLDTVLKAGQQVYTLNIKLMNKNMITNIEPIIAEHEIIGAVITLQKSQIVQMMAPEMQNEIYSRGFKANHRFEDFKVKSLSYGNMIKQAQLAAYSNAPVLIYGEEGTEVLRLAQCIHNDSGRRQNGFVEVDCGAWETEHLDEMFFGSKSHPGGENDIRTLVDLAEDGTLFLNHIDALKNELQFRIGRLIRGILPLSSNRQVPVNIRVIAATNENLSTLMNEGKFRIDLYYALNVITLDIPPLRERKEDLETWIDYFLDHYCNLYSRPIQLNKGACRFMCEYTWPGNIRQLENFCHRIVLQTPHRNIDEAFVRNQIDQLDLLINTEEQQKAVTINRDKNALKMLEALKRNNGNRTETARELGISKTTLWRLMQKYGITTDYSV